MDLNSKLAARVTRAAEAALAQSQFVSPVDVLVGLGWLSPTDLDRWRQGRVPDLEKVVQASLPKISTAMAVFRQWARERALRPSETAYLARTRDRRRLQFSRSGKEAIELAYRTHWVSPALSEAKQQRLAETTSRAPDLVVISPLKDWSCADCSGSGKLLIMEHEEPRCLSCADLDQLVFLPAGDVALTRRAKRASALTAVVVRFSRSRRRYERQGILVEEAALVRAETECLADEESRSRRRLRDKTAERPRMSSCRPPSPPRSPGCIPVVRRTAPRPSPGTPAAGTAAGWVGRRLARHCAPRRWWPRFAPPCGTPTPPTTSC